MGEYARVKELLWEKKDIINALADRLFEKETLVYNDLVAVMGPRPIPLKAEYEEFVTATSSEAKVKPEETEYVTDKAEESGKDKKDADGSGSNFPGNVAPA